LYETWKKLPFPLSLQVDYDRPNIFHLDDYAKETKKADAEEKAAQTHLRPSTSFFRDSCHRFAKNPVAMVAGVILIILILAIIIIPIDGVYPYSYEDMLSVSHNYDSSYNYLAPFQYSDTEKALQAAGQFVWPHIFGTDASGRDYFIRVIYGCRISLFVGLFAAIIVLIIGSIYGSVSGFFGGKVDMIMMRIVDVIYSIPDIVIIILLSVVFNKTIGNSLDGTFLAKLGPGMISIFIVFALLYWVGMARLAAEPVGLVLLAHRRRGDDAAVPARGLESRRTERGAGRAARRRQPPASALAGRRADRRPPRAVRTRRARSARLTSRPAQPAFVRIVTSSSAADGWTATVSSNCRLVAPIFTAMPAIWMISAASGPATCTPSTRSVLASTTSFISMRSGMSDRVTFIGRNAVR
jgi:ABC-type dipeptide/oligopeptide/nickel transport system permease subunit